MKKIVYTFLLFLFFCLQVEARTISFDTNWEYGSYAKITAGTSFLYEADMANGYTVALNASYGTLGDENITTLCHPDGSSTVTSGMNALGSTECYVVSNGSTFADGAEESEVTLEMANILKDILLELGYNVLMIRDDSTVELDDVARTVMANNNADIHVTFHWDSTATNKGVFFLQVPDVTSYKVMAPVNGMWQEHNQLGNAIALAVESAGIPTYNGGSVDMDLIQTSYSTIPSVFFKLGDRASNHDTNTLTNMAYAIADGINSYLGVSGEIPMPSNDITFDDWDISDEMKSVLEEAQASWPDKISEGRVEVIKAAASLVDKGIVYQYGALSSSQVLSNAIPAAVDCSDYVSWAFYNGGITDVGDNTTAGFTSHALFERINEVDLVPGDIALNRTGASDSSSSNYNHIGIYIGKINGENVFLHSESSGAVTGPQVRYGNGSFKIFYRYVNWGDKLVSTGTTNKKTGLAVDPYPNAFGAVQIDADYFSCDTLFYDADGNETTLKLFFDDLFFLIRIVTPVLVIILTTIDYMKAIASSNADATKKANERTIKRLVVGLLIFFLPLLLEILFELFGLYNIGTCGIGD